MPRPDLIRLVVLNFNGGSNVLRCIEHLEALDWPSDELELVVIDNASSDGSPAHIADRFPDVRIRPMDRNRGFPANNVALRDLEGVRYVGLVNDDAFVDPGYLEPLVAALDEDPRRGAVSPLMLFAHQFVEVAIEAPTTRPGRGDPRELGVQLLGLRVDGDDRWRRAHVAEGGYGPEIGRQGTFEWTAGRSILRVPVTPGEPVPANVALRVRALETRTAWFESGGTSFTASVGPEPSWIDVPLGGEPFDVVNNAGSVVLADGHGADRGFGERDLGQYDQPADVFAWCGGAVLLRPAYLIDVGLFDERFFLYYEDTDLSWRGQARRWGYRFVPEARVRHLHAASTVEGSARFHYYTERNRLLMLVKNAPAPMVREAVGLFLTQTYDAFRRDVAAALVQGRRPNALPVGRRLRALLGFLRRLPGMVRSRRRTRARQLVTDDSLASLLVSSGPS